MRYALILLLLLLQQNLILAVTLPEHSSDSSGHLHQHFARAAAKGPNPNDWLLKKQGDLRGYEILLIIAAVSLTVLFLFDLALIVGAVVAYRKFKKSTPRKMGKRIKEIVGKVEDIQGRLSSASPAQIAEVPAIIKSILEDLKESGHLR